MQIQINSVKTVDCLHFHDLNQNFFVATGGIVCSIVWLLEGNTLFKNVNCIGVLKEGNAPCL